MDQTLSVMRGARRSSALLLLPILLGLTGLLALTCSPNEVPFRGPGSPCPCLESLVCVDGACAQPPGPSECPEGTVSATVSAGESACVPEDDLFTIDSGVAKLDLLWVIDGSASMCHEHGALVKSFSSFVGELEAHFTGLDIRVAVTTTDAIGMAGRFSTEHAQQYPPACFESRAWPCLTNDDCVEGLGPGWECKPYPPDQMYNMNGSVNSSCIYRCGNDSDCCNEFCLEQLDAACGGSQSCIADKCNSAPSQDCAIECRPAGSDSSARGCLRRPDTQDCPSNIDPVLTTKELSWFKCIALVPTESSSSTEQGLRAAWLALDPQGPNSEQSASFIRPDAYLMVVFVTDWDDCSIDPDFASPNFQCDSDQDCPKGSTCRTDVYFSKMFGKKIKLCYGAIKKDYYNVCSLLGDFRGTSHHNCAYDLSCEDCLADEDCPYGWKCQQKMKCRPSIYSLSNIASYQQPPGTPILSMTPAWEYHARFKSLKADPAMVLIGAIVGDGLPLPPDESGSDKPSLLPDVCLSNGELKACQFFAQLKVNASSECIQDPWGQGCEAFLDAKKACIQECYVASMGDPAGGPMAKNTYLCAGEYGKAGLGTRYIALAQAFGPNGKVASLCAKDGMDTAMSGLADHAIRRMSRFCLPRASAAGEKVAVTLAALDQKGGTVAELLAQGSPPAGDYSLHFGVPSCCLPDSMGNCTGSSTAIVLSEPLAPGEHLSVVYASP